MAGTNKGFRIAANIIMVILSLCCLLPFILLFSASITDEATLTLYGYSFFPRVVNFRAYEYLFQSAGKIAKAYGITILVTLIGTTINVTMTLFVAYLLSKRDLPGRNFLSFFIFFTMLFSGGMVPSYIIWSQYMNVGDSLLALILPNLALSAYNVILMRTYFTTNIPQEILEAAEMDSCSQIGMLFRISIPLNNSMTIDQYNNGVSAGCYLGGYSADYIKALIAYSPYEPIEFQLTDLVGNSASVLGGWMISSVCKNPDAAMKALYLLSTDETIARMFILGLEGVHYTVDEKGIACRPEGVNSTNSNWNQDCPWFYPNQCLSIPLETEMTTYYTDMLDAPNHAEYSEAMGFVFDSEAVFDEMAACSTVVAEYRPALLYGLVDVDTYLEKFIEELKDAGIDKIIEAHLFVQQARQARLCPHGAASA